MKNHGYHAHIYFDDDTCEQAELLAKSAGEECLIKVGRMHHQPVGPHPRGSCQLAFGNSEFGDVIPWLNFHRNGLTVLVHTMTGDDLADHTTYAFWLGEPETLNLSQL